MRIPGLTTSPHRSKSSALPFLLLTLVFLVLGASSLKALVLEDYETGIGFTPVVSSSPSVVASTTVIAGQDGNALRLDYVLGGTGAFAVLSKDYSTRDFSDEGGNTVRFRLKASGNSNTFEMKFTDADSTDSAKSDKLDLKFLTTADNLWRTYTVAFSSFALFPDGNRSFDLSQVKRMSVGLTADNSARGAGTVWVDKIELLKSTSVLVDNFLDQADPNFFGGTNLNTFAANSGTATVSYVTLGGQKVFQLSYDVTPNAGAFSGCFMNLLAKDFQGYTHLTFGIRGNAGGEIVKAKLESSSTQGTEVFISTYLLSGITTTFQQVNIPLTDFTQVNISSVNAFTLVVTSGIGSGASTVWLDNVGFVRQNDVPKALRALDEMDMDVPSSNWQIFTHVDAALTATAITDASAPDAQPGNRVYQLAYNFTTSPSKPSETPYAVIDRPFELSIAPFTNLAFRYFGTGSSNNIEFKLIDDNGVVWLKRFIAATNTGGIWTSAAVPLSDLTLFPGSNGTTLNLKLIKKVEYAIVAGAGGSGVFALDTLEAPEGEFKTNGNGLISNFKIVNNPFSPNGDNIKDQAFFFYTLAAPSKVNLRVYNLEGRQVKLVGSQDQTAGDQFLSWDGRSDDGVIVSNGLYIYRLEAEGTDGRKDILRQIVGVLR